MKVFKFGGASVKDAVSVENVWSILKEYADQSVFVVISAMGKTTNQLETVSEAIYDQDQHQANLILTHTLDYHNEIIAQLTITEEQKSTLHQILERVVHPIREYIESGWEGSYNSLYDQIVSVGEIISTTIVSHFLEYKGLKNVWTDARDLIITDDSFRDARIDWEQTEKRVNRIDRNGIHITQGFIGRSKQQRLTTTLGREGSDFTASILAYCLHAESVTIWKDVEGVLNADPRIFQKVIKLDYLSYAEAIELTYLGASVIHPKTVKPLQNKQIPLIVRSFIHKNKKGTVIGPLAAEVNYPPCIIVKKNQVLLSFRTRDYAFVAEASLAKIFGLMDKYSLRAHLSQNSAISFSVCTDNDAYKLKPFLEEIQDEFEIEITEGLELVNLRHYKTKTLRQLIGDRSVLLEQRISDTRQIVLR
jgi:aspartate kinase